MSIDDGLMLTPRARSIVRGVLSPFADRIERVGVFGSRALGRARPASDIDLVLYGDLDDATLARIWSLFDQSSLAVTVDVVRYDAIRGTALGRHVDRYARTLLERTDLASPRPAT